jgi:hypothetical protein
MRLCLYVVLAVVVLGLVAARSRSADSVPIPVPASGKVKVTATVETTPQKKGFFERMADRRRPQVVVMPAATVTEERVRVPCPPVLIQK